MVLTITKNQYLPITIHKFFNCSLRHIYFVFFRYISYRTLESTTFLVKKKFFFTQNDLVMLSNGDAGMTLRGLCMAFKKGSFNIALEGLFPHPPSSIDANQLLPFLFAPLHC